MEQGQSRFLGSPGSFLYVRLHGGDVGALFFRENTSAGSVLFGDRAKSRF